MENNFHRFLLGLLAFTLLALVCILVLAGAMNSVWFWVAILFVLIPGLFATLTPQQRRKFYERLVDNVLTLTAIIVTLALGIALILWAVVNFAWQPEYDAQVTAVVLDHQDVYVTVSHPGAALADGQPVELRIAIVNRGAVTETLGITAVLPSASRLTFATPPMLTAVTVPPNDQLTQTIALVNVKPPSGVSTTQPVTTTVTLAGAIDEQQTSLIVEGKWGLRLRRLVNSTVDKASPLIILIAFLFPALIQISQQYVRERKSKRQEEKKLLEMQKTQEARQQQEKQRQALNQLVQKLRHSITAADWSEAAQILTHLDQPEWQSMAFQEKEKAQKLLALAALSCPPEDVRAIVQECAVWPDECVTAFLDAWDIAKRPANENKTYSNALQKARYLLPLQNVNHSLQNRLANLEIQIIEWEKAHFEYQVTRDWPVTPQRPPFLFTEPSLFVQGIPGKRDPFACKAAEEELYYLFSFREKEINAFWSGHPLFAAFYNIDRAALVFGASGNGRTALAYALHYQAPLRKVMALHLPDRPQPNEIRAGMITYLLDFVLAHPAYLRRLAPAQRRLLARLLVSVSSPTTLQALIEARQSAIYLSFSDTPADEQDDLTARLQLLAEDITQAGSLSPGDNSSWARDVTIVAQALDFARVLLILDIGHSKDDVTWLQGSLLPHILPWQRQELFTILLLPEEDQIKAVTANLHPVFRQRLVWSQDELKKVLTWRYKAFAGLRRAITDHFENGAFDFLISQCLLVDWHGYSPRVFCQLWQHIIAGKPPETLITSQDVAQAVAATLGEARPAVEEEKEKATVQIEKAIPDRPKIKNNDLLKIMVEYFNLEELRTLCFDVGVEYEDIPSTGNKESFVREIIKYFDRRNRRHELEDKILELRPQTRPYAITRE